MAGGLISYGDALKAFRRGVYQFPHEWSALVVCSTGSQRTFAMGEAARIIEASSLKLEEVDKLTCEIRTERGGKILFRTAENEIMGYNFPHIIVLGDLKPEVKERMERYQRHSHIDPKYFLWHNCTI